MMERKLKDSGIPWIGLIPEHWKASKIGQLYDNRYERVSDKDFGPLSVTMQGILPQLETAAKTDDGDNRKLVKKGDFAINSRSDRRGSCGISPQDGSVSLINLILAPRTSMNPDYYNWLFHTSLFADEFYSWGHGIVADLWTTRWQEMKNISIPVPPMEEQERIAAWLDAKCGEIDELIVVEQRMIADLEAYRQAVITEAVTHGLHPDTTTKDCGYDWIGKIPSEWNIKRLRFLGTTQNGISKDGSYFGDGFPFVNYGDVYNNVFLPENPVNLCKSDSIYQQTYSIEYGDVLFTRTSETIEEIGFSAACRCTIPQAVFSGFLIRFRPTTNEIIPEYAGYYFRSNIHRTYFVKEMNIVTRASLGQNLLRNLPVLLPPLSEQREIAHYLDLKCGEIDELIKVKQEKIETLKQYRQSLIFEAVTGKTLID